MFRDSKWWFS